MPRILNIEFFTFWCVLFCVCNFQTFQAQNLVLNPSFEDFTSCPSNDIQYNGIDQLVFASGWKSAYRTPQYFNSCNGSGSSTYGVPSNVFGYQPAATGNGYVGAITYSRDYPITRNLFCGTLSAPLVVSREYEVSYKVCVGNPSAIAINKLGVDFSTNLTGCYWSGTLPSPNCLYPLSNSPDLWSDQIITDSVNWTTLSWTFTATEASKYIIIGVFHDVCDEVVLSNSPSGYFPAYHFFDDVSVVEIIPCTISLSHTNISCFGENDGSIVASIDSGNGPFSYTWSPTPTAGQGTNSISSLSAQTYTLLVENAEGSCSASATIEESDSIALDLQTIHPICGNEQGEAFILASGGSGNFTYTWDTDIPSSNPHKLNLAAGQHTVLVTDDANCSKNLIFNLQDQPLPVSVDVTNLVLSPGDSIQLIANGASSYVWSPDTDLSCTYCSNPYASPSESIVYTLTGSDENGCEGFITVSIIVDYNCQEVFVPSIFSPNGDGNNDELCVYNNCLKELNFIIYNRWGQPVFKSEWIDACWDGNLKNEASEVDTYIYKLYAILKDGQLITQTGNISLIR